MYLNLIILLYADDTVHFNDSETGLQYALNTFTDYCAKWKLQVNTSKIKYIIFHSRGNINNRLRFTFGENEIEIIKYYKYLGIHFSQSGSFAQAKKHIAEQAVFALLKNIKRLSLLYDLKIDLFSKTIKPILLYGCGIWDMGNNEVIERLQLNYS